MDVLQIINFAKKKTPIFVFGGHACLYAGDMEIKRIGIQIETSNHCMYMVISIEIGRLKVVFIIIWKTVHDYQKMDSVMECF